MKFRAGGFWVPVKMELEGTRLFLSFPYFPALIEEVKAMEGAKWHGRDERPRKAWSIKDSERNRFQIAWLSGENPYAPYEQDIRPWTSERPLFKHQFELAAFAFARRRCILAAEPGTGKTLIVQEVMERCAKEFGWHDHEFIYVCKNGALTEITFGFRQWHSQVWPRFMSYEQMVKLVGSWQKGQPAPKFVVFDESTMIKNPTAIRSQCALHLALSVRREHDGFVILMSGTPAPRSPADWWHQCEVACPGYLKEGAAIKLQKRLAIIEMKEAEAGGSYPKLVTWKDDPKKCNICGTVAEDPKHLEHVWTPSVDEVSKLYRRMEGLVKVKLKQDCLDLPPKVHRVIRCKPTQQTLNAARLIDKRAGTVIEALTLRRELSDGFQYLTEQQASDCPQCFGKGCNCCEGGQVYHEQRKVVRMPCPKDDVLRELIEEHSDFGRLVTYAGFTESVNRIVAIFLSMNWRVIRVDGRGWHGFGLSGTRDELYAAFRNRQEASIAFVAQSGTAGYGLNLSASPTIIFYSNDFDFEHRSQAEERNDRPGIEATLEGKRNSILIVDIYHLESDEFVRENHRQKRLLQGLTMGEFREAMLKEEA